MTKNKLSGFFKIIAPGLLVAATGVGGGDLATGSFAGGMLGTAVLWAVVVGAFLKYVLTEGIARWQLATDSTLVEGMATHLGAISLWLFMPYLILWTFFTATAMMSGCGVALAAIFPIFEEPANGKIFFGIISSLIGVVLIEKGGFQLFEKIMTVSIGFMFVTVVLTAILMWPGIEQVLRGLLVPTIPDFSGQGLTWTVALMGGVGGTVTILSYGYWIREEGRSGGDDLATCRIDLFSCYTMTAIFGLAVVIIGSQVEIEGGGAALLVNLADQLGEHIGIAGRWLFLIGALGAVFSSLLGVWQAIPYLFTDAWQELRGRNAPLAVAETGSKVSTKSASYRVYLLLMATIPMLGLFTSFREVQKLYTVTGAFFLPLLALVLLILNSQSRYIGVQFQNRLPATISLCAVLIFFLWVAITKILG